MNKWLEEYNRKIRIPSITEKITYIKSILEFQKQNQLDYRKIGEEQLDDTIVKNLQSRLSVLTEKKSKLTTFPFKN